LSCASEAICVEPFMDPGKNLQAINRLYHIQKNKEMLIHYFVIKGTVEETIVKQLPIPYLKRKRVVRDSEELTEEQTLEEQKDSSEQQQQQRSRPSKRKKANHYTAIYQEEMKARRGAELNLEFDLAQAVRDRMSSDDEDSDY